jgi:adenylate cyclase
LYRFHFWLRFRPWYRRVAPAFLSCVLLLPVLGLLGFPQAGHQIDNFIERDPNWIEQLLERTKVPPRSERKPLYHLNDAIVGTYAGLLVLTMLARVIRDISGRRKRIRINYPGDHEVYAPRGFTVLEASRFAGITHTSICGGRGRCSTCRIGVSEGLSKQPPPSSAEQRVLRVGAALNVRLACQLWPVHDLSITPLVPANAHTNDGYGQPSYFAGQERTIAVLFADLRTFTRIGEQKLPYDLVFLLNSYFEAAGKSITRAGGVVDKFIGDGVMALVGSKANSNNSR